MAPTLAAGLADATLALHVGMVAFVLSGALAIVAGGVLGWRWVRGRAFRITHLALVASSSVGTDRTGEIEDEVEEGCIDEGAEDALGGSTSPPLVHPPVRSRAAHTADHRTARTAVVPCLHRPTSAPLHRRRTGPCLRPGRACCCRPLTNPIASEHYSQSRR